ncbi:MAG: hypothetical protein AUK48_01615 [Oscillatoriales cyanobacterium CG2_30_44_21]|nr:MAG: hypothetical protein AUK48_01615 [Oscillatoriales cyanobacterium CG2_30_44_21]
MLVRLIGNYETKFQWRGGAAPLKFGFTQRVSPKKLVSSNAKSVSGGAPRRHSRILRCELNAG